MRKNKAKHPLCLIFYQGKNDGRFGHASVRFAIEKDEEPTLGDYDWEAGQNIWVNIALSCQWNNDTPDEGKEYGFKGATTETYALDLREAKNAVKALRKIESAEIRFPIHPSTFGEYVALVMSGLKINKCFFWRQKDSAWCSFSGGSTKDYIDENLSEVKEKGRMVEAFAH